MPMLRAVRLFNAIKIGSVLGTDALMTSTGISGTSLESYLTVGTEAAGRRSDVSEMFSMRDQVRMLGSSVTGMEAVLNSPKARELAFTLADAGSNMAVKYMAGNSIAMGLITKSEASLTAIVNNDASMAEFVGSAFFEGVDGINALNAIMSLSANLDVGDYTTMPLLIASSSGASGDVSDSLPAIKVAAQSTSIMNAIAANGPMVDSILGKSDQVDAIIASDIAMYELVRSPTALTEVAGDVSANAKIAASPTAIKVAMASPLWYNIIDGSSTIASNLRNVLVNGLDLDSTIGAASIDVINHFDSVNAIASSVPAMVVIADAIPDTLVTSPILNAYLANFNGAKFLAEHTGATAAAPTTALPAAAMTTLIAANSAAWTKYKASPYFTDNLVATICSLTGLAPVSYPTVTDFAASSAALTAIVGSAAATEALSTSSGILSEIITQGHIGIILGSSTAMTYFGTEAGLSTMLANSATHSSIFGPASGAAARAAILQSTALVDQMAANSAIAAIIGATTVTAIPTNLRAGTTSTNEPFGGFPDKFIAIGLRANNIGAIAANYNFAGNPAAGTGATTTIGLKGTVTESVFFGFTTGNWTVAGIAATAAVSPEVTYYDMT
jgi:hypothetical protein